MKSRAGKNTYTNGGKRSYFFGYPCEGDPGYSDCSSAVRACIKKAAGIDIGTSTDAQLRNYKKGVVVDNTSGGYPSESRLLPGDCLYFKGNKSHFKSVGHVEMYTGKNECWGHGSGIGPKKHNLQSYCKSRLASGKPYFCAVRWILEPQISASENTPTQEDSRAAQEDSRAEVYPANPMPVRWRGIAVAYKWQSKSASKKEGTIG